MKEISYFVNTTDLLNTFLFSPKQATKETKEEGNPLDTPRPPHRGQRSLAESCQRYTEYPGSSFSGKSNVSIMTLQH